MSENWIKATNEKPMTHCDKCNRQVPMDDNIMNCSYCGAEIHEPTGPECPNCGTQMQDNCRKCVVCGAEIAGRYDDKPAKLFLSSLVYQKPDGLYGFSIFGKFLFFIIVMIVLLIYALFKGALF